MTTQTPTELYNTIVDTTEECDDHDMLTDEDNFMDGVKEALIMQHEILDALLTLWERMCIYSYTEVPNEDAAMKGIHPRVRQALINLESVLQEHDLLVFDVIERDEE